MKKGSMNLLICKVSWRDVDQPHILAQLVPHSGFGFYLRNSNPEKTKKPVPYSIREAKISLPHTNSNYWQQLNFDAKI